VQIAQQADGKILIVIVNATDSGSATILRLNADGSRDASFGDNGMISGLAIQPIKLIAFAGGKIMLLGTAAGSKQPEAIQLNADGKADAHFGTAGALQINDSELLGAAIVDGETVVLGLRSILSKSGHRRNQIVLMKLTATGGIDPAFGEVDGATMIITPFVSQQQPSSFDGTRFLVPVQLPTASLIAIKLDGTMDLKFGTKGALTDLNAIQFAAAPGVRLVGASGIYSNDDGQGNISEGPGNVSVYTPHAKVDSSFGDDGGGIFFAPDSFGDGGVNGTAIGLNDTIYVLDFDMDGNAGLNGYDRNGHITDSLPNSQNIAPDFDKAFTIQIRWEAVGCWRSGGSDGRTS
jgi:uncharacterized delta-60 repeat protein